MASLSLNNEVLATYIFYGSVLVLKVLFMTLWTAKHRIAKKIFVNQEDYDAHSGKGHKPQLKATDDDIERVRRAHLNDLENILPFLICGLLFVMSGPDVTIAKWLFRVFTAGRFVYTIGYLNAVHGLRGFGFLSSLAVNLTMTIMVICKSFGNF